MRVLRQCQRYFIGSSGFDRSAQSSQQVGANRMPATSAPAIPAPPARLRVQPAAARVGSSVMRVSPLRTRTTVAVPVGCNPAENTHAPAARMSAATWVTSAMMDSGIPAAVARRQTGRYSVRIVSSTFSDCRRHRAGSYALYDWERDRSTGPRRCPDTHPQNIISPAATRRARWESARTPWGGWARPVAAWCRARRHSSHR